MLQTIRSEAELGPWLDDWRRLAGGIPFRQPEWLLPWFRNFSNESSELHVTIATDEEGMLRALVPLYFDASSQALRLLGDGLVCSDYTGFLSDDHYLERNLVTLVVDYLLGDAMDVSLWKTIHFEAIDPSDRDLQWIRMELTSRRANLLETNSANTWAVDLGEGWTHFLASVSKNARKTFRKRAEDLGKVRVRWVSDFQDFEEFLPILIDLHQRRRQSVGDPGCFADHRFEPFLREVASGLIARNQLQAFTLWMNDDPIAAEIGFRSRNRWFCYQSGIDPDYLEHEPGKLANVFILRDAERFGIRYVDFLRGDEPYKQLLKANPTPVQDWIFTRPNLDGAARHFWMSSRDKVKHVARQVIRKVR